MSLAATVREDLRAMIPRRPGIGGLLAAVLKVATYPRLWAILLHRLAHPLHRRRLYPLSYALHAAQQVLTGAEVHPAAEIGPGWCLLHSRGVVIGDRVRVGRGFRCFHGVTLGDDGRRPGQPALGDGVTVGAGAKVLGPVTLGDGATVGANAVVLCDVPPGGVAVGVPARVLPPRRDRYGAGTVAVEDEKNAPAPR